VATGSDSVEAAKAQHEIVARRTGSDAAVPREATLILGAAPMIAAARAVLRLRSRDWRLDYAGIESGGR